MQSPDAKPDSSAHPTRSSEDEQALFTRYRLIRDEIVHEDGLIGQRLAWFVASQAFLLSTLAIANGNQHAPPSSSNNCFFPLVPLVAIASCILIFAGVIAGVEALRQWRTMIATSEYADAARFPRISRDGMIIRLGWAAPIVLPVIFLAAWIYVLAQGLGR